MKTMQCKDCGKSKNVPDDEREPFICAPCMELHKENEGRDLELEQELNEEYAQNKALQQAEGEAMAQEARDEEYKHELERDAKWDYEARAELNELRRDEMIESQIDDAIMERLEKKELRT